jgi:hypothetical protein
MAVTGSGPSDLIAKSYRGLLPLGLRSVLYFGRRSAKEFLHHGYGPEFLTEWAIVRVAAGFGSARVRTNGLTLTVNLQDYAVAG